MFVVLASGGSRWPRWPVASWFCRWPFGQLVWSLAKYGDVFVGGCLPPVHVIWGLLLIGYPIGSLKYMTEWVFGYHFLVRVTRCPFQRALSLKLHLDTYGEITCDLKNEM